LKTSREDKTPIQALAALHESASLRAVTGPAVRPGGFRLTERGLALGGISPGGRVLDVGCGTGATVDYLRAKHRFRAFGVDMSGGLFREAGTAEPIPLALARAEELPFADCCCDGVLCECVLSLVKDPQRTVREFQRVLRADGVLILSDVYERQPDSGGSIVSADSGRCPPMLQTRTFIEQLLGDSGFELLVWEDHTRHLKELAAQLILSSEPHAEIHEYCSILNSGCAGLPGSRPFSPGYCLLVACNSKKGERLNG
jgi:SAM-dependent methyltransferase